MKFEIGDKVFLKIALMKRVMRFEKKGRISPRCIGLYEIFYKIGDVAYKLALPPILVKVHNVFYLSMLRKYTSNPSHILKKQPIELDKNLIYEEWAVQILDRKEKELHNKNITLVKVL